MQRQADFQRKTSRRRFHRSFPKNRRPFASRFLCEELEDRRLLCGLSHEFLIEPPQWNDAFERQFVAAGEGEPGAGGGPEVVGIVWTNRGQTSDNFNATFGNSANAARAVVDAAIDDWERVITNWNRDNGTQTLQINVSINGIGFGAAGARLHRHRRTASQLPAVSPLAAEITRPIPTMPTAGTWISAQTTGLNSTGRLSMPSPVGPPPTWDPIYIRSPPPKLPTFWA